MTRCWWGRILSCLWVVVMTQSGAAHAQGAGDKAAAEALFDEGRKLMTSGDYAVACPKLEASQALDPGVGTMLNLADCYEKSGRTASAWAQFRETSSAAHKAGSLERERVARQREQQLEPKLSYLTIVTWKGQDVRVARDGIPIDAAVLGTAIPVDPGKHVVSASSSGKRSWSTDVTVGTLSDRVSVSVPILPDEPEQAGPVLAQEAQPPASKTTVADSGSAAHDSGSTRRILAIVAAGVGVVGLATGTIFGVKAASTWSDAKASCDPYPYCGEKAPKLSKDAAESGTISTIAFVVGGVGLAAGALLWFMTPARPTEAHAALDVGPGSVTVHGRF